jgi:hypothetical protein
MRRMAGFGRMSDLCDDLHAKTFCSRGSRAVEFPEAKW